MASLDGAIGPFVGDRAAGAVSGDVIENDDDDDVAAAAAAVRRDCLIALSFVRVTAASVRSLPEFRHRISLPKTHAEYPPSLPRQSPNGHDPLWRWELQSPASCVLW